VKIPEDTCILIPKFYVQARATKYVNVFNVHDLQVWSFD
jgi:hypothetical protein